MKSDDLETLQRAIKLLREAQELCSQAGEELDKITPPEDDEDKEGIHMETVYMMGYVYQQVDLMAGALHLYGERFGPDQADLFPETESQVITSGR